MIMAPPPPTENDPKRLMMVDYIYSHFIKGGSVQRGSNPGFAHAMKLSYNTIDKNRLSVLVGGPKSLTYRYRLSNDVPKWTVSLLTALMDELSTSACFRVGLPCPPGVSLQMQTELIEGADLSSSSNMKEVDVVNIVTKLGKTVSYTRTEFRCATSDRLIAFSSHVKYMPTGSRITDLFFRNTFLFELFERLYLRKLKVPWYEEKSLFQNVIQSHLEFHGIGRATFHITREHTNPFGALHGGCHAMIMEQVAESFAKDALQSEVVLLQSIQIDFLSAASKGSVEVLCEAITATTTTTTSSSSSNSKEEIAVVYGASSTLQVRVLLKRGERTCSEGRLRFSVSRIQHHKSRL
jgi:acyl-coenzyme A thioesterase PaaI-like protein